MSGARSLKADIRTTLRWGAVTAKFALIAMICGTAFLGARCAPGQPGMAPGKIKHFEVASIRMIPEKDVVPLLGSPISPPGSGLFRMREVTLPFAIAWAFRIDQDLVSGGPDWLSHQYYEISAKPEGDAALSYEELQPLVQHLLQERFHLTFHRVTQNRKGYALLIAKSGPKLTPAKGGAGYGYILTDRIQMANVPMQSLASMLTHVMGQPVADQTGMKGNYDIKLNFAPMDGEESSYPSISTAVEEQLGLKMVSRMVPVETLVIDHVDREPTEN